VAEVHAAKANGGYFVGAELTLFHGLFGLRASSATVVMGTTTHQPRLGYVLALIAMLYLLVFY
jgi:hypothetical protein